MAGGDAAAPAPTTVTLGDEVVLSPMVRKPNAKSFIDWNLCPGSFSKQCRVNCRSPDGTQAQPGHERHESLIV